MGKFGDWSFLRNLTQRGNHADSLIVCSLRRINILWTHVDGPHANSFMKFILFVRTILHTPTTTKRGLYIIKTYKFAPLFRHKSYIRCSVVVLETVMSLIWKIDSWTTSLYINTYASVDFDSINLLSAFADRLNGPHLYRQTRPNRALTKLEYRISLPNHANEPSGKNQWNAYGWENDEGHEMTFICLWLM